MVKAVRSIREQWKRKDQEAKAAIEVSRVEGLSCAGLSCGRECMASKPVKQQSNHT